MPYMKSSPRGRQAILGREHRHASGVARVGISPLILGVLATFLVADAGCFCGGSSDFEHEERLTADELPEGPLAAPTEEMCTEACAARVIVGSIEGCELLIDEAYLEVLENEMTGSEGETDGESDNVPGTDTDTDIDTDTDTDAGDTANTEIEAETVATLRCSGTVSPICLGRRPLGHVDQPGTVAPALAQYTATCAHLEQASVTAFRELAALLERMSAPVELIERCRQAALDEVEHARLFHALARDLGATIVPPSQRKVASSLVEVAVHNAVEGCVHETWAAFLASWSAERAHGAVLRAVHQQLAPDELEHAELSWMLLTWLYVQLDESGKTRVRDALRTGLARLPALARTQAATIPAELGLPQPETLALAAASVGKQLSSRARALGVLAPRQVAPAIDVNETRHRSSTGLYRQV